MKTPREILKEEIFTGTDWYTGDIESQLEQVMIDFAKQYHESELKNIGFETHVSNQRELLIAFWKDVSGAKDDDIGLVEAGVDAWIKGNSFSC